MPVVNEQSWIPAQWPAPANVVAGITTRIGGTSQGEFSSLNLATHVGDVPESVAENRLQLKQFLQLPDEPRWLEQVHGVGISTENQIIQQADASVTHVPGHVCVVMTADCLPVLITDQNGKYVAAVHAGWRGLQQKIIVRCIEKIPVLAESLLVWLGPAIGPAAFEVGAEVREQFLQQNPEFIACFIGSKHKGKWMMDMYGIARLQLAAAGVKQIYGGQFCTYADVTRFYSYRREGRTGRMASLIWMNQ